MTARIRANARALNPQFVLPALVVGGALLGAAVGTVVMAGSMAIDWLCDGLARDETRRAER